MMLVPPLSVWRILISRRILVFLTTGCKGDLELTWLEDLDDDALVVGGVDALVDLGVLATADLLDDLVVVLGAKLDFEVLVVGVFRWQLTTHIRVVFRFMHFH
jgi:hypothetical protein